MLTSIAVALSFSGCGTPFLPKISDLDPNKLGPVSVNLDQDGADRPKYLSDASGYGTNAAQVGVGGIATALIWRSVSLSGGQAEIDKLSHATGPFERPLILNNVQAALKSAGVNIQPNARASLTLKLVGYGIYKNSQEMGYGRVDGFATLKNASGRLVWKAEVSGLSSSAYNIKDLFANPELYKQAIQSASANFANLMYSTPTIPDIRAKRGYEEAARTP